MMGSILNHGKIVLILSCSFFITSCGLKGPLELPPVPEETSAQDELIPSTTPVEL